VRSLRMTSRWRRLCEALGATPEGGDGLFDALVQRYVEPHRRYHTLVHVESVLTHIDGLVQAGEPVEDRWAVELAAWFHDAVHEPTGRDDEARSAQLAVEMLGVAGVGPARLERVSDLVMATEHHVPDGPDAALLVDADLAILGADRDGYLAYAEAIREEYAVFDDARYRDGRVAVLHGLLDRPLLYHTRTMREARAQRAKANLGAELRALTSAPGVAVGVALRRAIA
jgi:predicted metal-dependent HD superfamily phosphohydrolase